MGANVSIITVVFNGGRYLEDCIQSVLTQDYPNIEYLIIDGGSTDGSLKIAQKYINKGVRIVSEADEGMYDAMNKGIGLSTGEIIGMLHADDFFVDSQVVSKIVEKFAETNADAVYGDLDYVDGQTLFVKRRWRSHQHQRSDFVFGWMPAHPTLYIKTKIYQQFGGYSLKYGSASDYELMLRVLYRHQIKAAYLPVLLVKMRIGGVSNATFKDRLHAFKFDFAAASTNHVPMALMAIILKKLRKVKQFFR